MKKYRIRTEVGRMYGPFTADGIRELISSGAITIKDKVQSFPVGDWIEIENEPDVRQLFQSYKEKIASDFQEFSFKNKEAEVVDYEAMERRHVEKIKELDALKAELAKLETESGLSDESDDEKTLIRNKKRIELDEKTLINLDTKKYLEQLAQEKKLADEELEKKKNELQEFETTNDDKLDTSSATQFIDIQTLLPDIKEVVDRVQIEKNQKEIQTQKYREEQEKLLEANDSSEQKKKPKAKKSLKTTIYLLAIIAVIFYFYNDDKKPIGNIPIYTPVVFPVAGKVLEATKGKIEFDKAMTLLNDKAISYDRILEALILLRKSLELDYGNKEVKAQLAYWYSAQLDTVKDVPAAKKVIFDLLQIMNNEEYTKAEVTIAFSNLYLHSKKPKTALNTLENYLRLGKPDLNFLEKYLFVLLQNGDLVKASKVIEKIKDAQLTSFGIITLGQYYLMNDDYDSAYAVLKKGKDKYPKAVNILVALGDFFIRIKKFDELKMVTKEILKYNAEHSPVYYSRLYEFQGLLSALNKKNDEAVALFKKALETFDTDELRSKLASLEVGGSSSVDRLIQESKAITFMSKAQKARDDRNWEAAIKFAVDAADVIDDYIPAKLLLASIQVDQGYFESAIKTLTKLAEEYPSNKNVNMSLISAYVSAFKIDDAMKQIRAIQSTKLQETAEFSLELGKLYEQKNSTALALQWYQKAITIDPVSDEAYFRMANLLYNNKKFSKAKVIIAQALSLSPDNVEYKRVYSRILYEMDSAETAIGYLRKLLESSPDNAVYLGEIAKYYYKIGQMKDFEDAHKKVESLPYPDPEYYKFLVQQYKLEDKLSEVVIYSQKLLKISPGDLLNQMELGTYYFEKEKFQEAEKVFSAVKERLQTYPRINYFLAKTYLAMKNNDRAAEFAQAEIKANPTLEYGFFVQGEIFKETGKYSDAVTNFEKALALNPNSYETLTSIGWIKYKQNYLVEAREYYMRSLKQKPDNAIANRDLGHVYRAIGQAQLANESYKVYLDLKPNASDKAEIEQIMKTLQ